MKVNYDEPVQNLPDAYDKSVDSNNNKLFLINKNTTDDIKTVLSDIFNVLNINNVSGGVLDDIWGGRLHLKRGGLSDEQYLIRLRAKMMQNIANGSFFDLVRALAYALQCDTSAIHIVESDTPNRVKVKDIPLEIVFNAEFTIMDVIIMIESMLPLGVKIEEYGFTGTFEFSDIDNEYDPNKGFADADSTVGGYLGLMGRMIV